MQRPPEFRRVGPKEKRDTFNRVFRHLMTLKYKRLGSPLVGLYAPLRPRTEVAWRTLSSTVEETQGRWVASTHLLTYGSMEV
jgi:hypothetical protein